MAQRQGEVATGTEAAETLRGGAAMDVLSGLGGDDSLWGLGSGDALSGGAGADRLRAGAGDDFLFVDRDDAVIDGGAGIDVALLAPSDLPYTFAAGAVRGIETFQDSPGADTTLILEAEALKDLDDDTLLFSLGDGTDEVRIVEFGAEPVSVDGDRVVFDGEVVLRFEGVESLTLSGGADGSTSIVSQSLSPGAASSTTLRTFSSGGGTTTTTTSIATEAEVPETGQEDLSAAGQAARLVEPGDGLAAHAASLFDLLAAHAEEADERRAQDAVEQGADPSDSLFSNQGLLDADEVFGLLSQDILSRFGGGEVGALNVGALDMGG